jgi:hypothetical protein
MESKILNLIIRKLVMNRVELAIFCDDDIDLFPFITC